MTEQEVCFVNIQNKWIKYTLTNANRCCVNKCFDKISTTGKKCLNGNGFINMVDDENIKYINCVEGKGYNKEAFIESENSFNKPKEDSINYSLFYFEIKCIIEHDKNWFDFGLKNKHGGEVFLEARNTYIRNENSRRYKLPPTFSWNNGDVFGCGLVYPPNNKINELPYVFFTQNGKQLGKATLLKNDYDSYKPCIHLQSCSLEANFGNDLNKPFIYDIKKHLVLTEFYVNKR